MLGIDPGTATLGYGVIAVESGRLTFRACGALNTPSTATAAERLLQLYDGLQALMETHRPSEIAVEQLFFAKNHTTAMAVGQARGVVLLAAAKEGLLVGEYTPMQVKQAVAGQGRIDKRRVQQMVRMILGLTFDPQPDDAADALAIAICHANARAYDRRMAHAR